MARRAASSKRFINTGVRLEEPVIGFLDELAAKLVWAGDRVRLLQRRGVSPHHPGHGLLQQGREPAGAIRITAEARRQGGRTRSIWTGNRHFRGRGALVGVHWIGLGSSGERRRYRLGRARRWRGRLVAPLAVGRERPALLRGHLAHLTSVGKEEDGPFRISMIGRLGGNWRAGVRRWSAGVVWSLCLVLSVPIASCLTSLPPLDIVH